MYFAVETNSVNDCVIFESSRIAQTGNEESSSIKMHNNIYSRSKFTNGLASLNI